MDSESKTHDTNNDSEVKLSDTQDSKESRKVQADFLENPNQNEVKRSISRSEVYATSETSTEKSNRSTDESSSKRQKLNESGSNTTARNVSDDILTFQRNELKVEQQNYCKEQNTTEDISWNSLFNEITREAPILNVFEGNIASANTENDSAQKEPSNRSSEINILGSETFNVESDRYKNERADSDECSTANNDELNEEEEDEDEDEAIPHCLKVTKSPPNWFIVPEVINRQIGSNSLFQRRFYGSLHAVERLEFMHDFNACENFIRSLNFNRKGNLLASASADLVSIWDWAAKEKRHCFTSSHIYNVSHVEWLPLDVENFMVTSGGDGMIRLWNLECDTSEQLMKHDGFSEKLAVHPEIPYEVFSVGIDSRVLFRDIRESEPNELLVVTERSGVRLHSIHLNPSNSNEFCVSGLSYCVRVYDRRKATKPLYKLSSDYVVQDGHAFIKSAIYNHNGTEILALLNNVYVLLYDKLMWSCEKNYSHMYQSPRFAALDLRLVNSLNYFGPKSEFVMCGSFDGEVFFYDKDTEAVIQWLTLYDSNILFNRKVEFFHFVHFINKFFCFVIWVVENSFF
ncbi:DDB1- and CUL4-associated factor 8 [Trachymyrmex zeteki]|uniref:DDB1-and CUL4-associated factor 8 n=1 Tax=Mycetomoellerius zeteki TaxID=64791 RepID=A0A151XHE2_9HYME|nr:DDB1- and CUL4-associated factor 8 [Trachymyrmex zeteki]